MDKEEKKLADAYDRGLLKTENPPDDLLDLLKPVSYTHLTLPTICSV